MNSSFRRLKQMAGWATTLIALAALPLSALPLSAHADQPDTTPKPVDGSSVLAAASLHNPGFDNHDWYEFNGRYGNYMWGSWVPDDDNNDPDQEPLPSTLQDWRLWFLDGADIILVGEEPNYVQSGEAVQIHSYGPYDQIGGLYQIIYNTTPCLTYQFQMYAQSRPWEPGDYLTALQVGIDRAGWYPTAPDFPAVHSFPGSTVWGTDTNAYQWFYGLLSVTAEVTNTAITVWTYADASGGSSHHIFWDTGSFQDVTPSVLVSDPNNPPAPSGITSLAAITGSTTTAIVNWVTPASALGQVYYRWANHSSVPIVQPLTHKVYLPFVSANRSSILPNPWSWTTLNKTPVNPHSGTLTNLLRGSVYEYFVVSKGVSGGQCVTWVSDKQTFTTAP